MIAMRKVAIATFINRVGGPMPRCPIESKGRPDS